MRVEVDPLSDAEFDSSLRARVKGIEELMPALGSRGTGLEHVSPRLRGRLRLGSVSIGIVVIAGLFATATLWKPAANGVVPPVASVRTTPSATVLAPAGGAGVSGSIAEAAARSHVLPEAVLISAIAGRFDAVYEPFGDQSAATLGIAPADLVWVLTFREDIVICPPPYVEKGVSQQKPCLSPRAATVSVVLDYSTGAFLASDGYAPAP